MCPTLLLIEPNEFVRLGVIAACESQSMRLLGSTDSIAEGAQLAGKTNPDVIVVGVSSPDDGVQNKLHVIRAAAPDAKLLLWSDESTHDSYQSLLSDGWSGWVQRTLDVDDFLFSVRAIANGRQLFIHDADHHTLAPHRQKNNEDVPLNDAAKTLSAREYEVLKKLADGCTNKEIAEQIFLSVKTVETYRSRLMKKLGLRSRSDLVRWVQMNDLADYAEAS